MSTKGWFVCPQWSASNLCNFLGTAEEIYSLIERNRRQRRHDFIPENQLAEDALLYLENFPQDQMLINLPLERPPLHVFIQHLTVIYFVILMIII